MESRILTVDDDRLLKFQDQISSIAEMLGQVDPNDITDDEEKIKQFKAFRLKWLHVVEEVEIGILEIVVSRLTALEAEFTAGIDTLKSALQEANDIVAILSLIGKTLLIIGQIVALAV
jgi:hypothetical protein